MTIETSSQATTQQNSSNVNIFDLLGGKEQVKETQPTIYNNNYPSNSGFGQPGNNYQTSSSINFTGMPLSNPYQSNSFANVSLSNNFQTENVRILLFRIYKITTQRISLIKLQTLLISQTS